MKEVSDKKSRSWIVFLVFGIIGLVGGIASILLTLLMPKETLADLSFPQVPSQKQSSAKYYSNLTGLELPSESSKTAPTYCVQIPNGTDGARPQVGLNEAGVIFEAIAEAGITRFAAIYQNPTSAAIGPIRSLRLYYLQWDTPFDCTVVHAGGADDALAALRQGGYKDLTENYSYMYRDNNGGRRWNNLFTTGALLTAMNSERGYGSSNVKGFTRMTPVEAVKNRIKDNGIEELDILESTTRNTSEITPKTPNINIRFGGWPSYNIQYSYNTKTNSYDRSYESGVAHEIYACPSENLGTPRPENVCTLKQLSPTVVVAMFVNERRASDGYHEDITTIGSGEAYIFQNGTVAKVTWNKNSVNDQIKFLDDNNNEIALIPGQTFIEAVPTYGSIEY